MPESLQIGTAFCSVTRLLLHRPYGFRLLSRRLHSRAKKERQEEKGMLEVVYLIHGV